jgi:ankyrin repeat protein
MNAAKLGHLETVRLLLAAGADPFQAYSGETALDAARERGHAEIAELLEDAMQRHNPG